MKKSVLAIGTHPDDIEIGCGGTLCLLRDQGYEIIHLSVTSGEEGSMSFEKNKLIQTRKNESQSSAEIIGTSRIIFLEAPDGFTSFSKEMKVKIISYIREIRPEIVFTHSKSDHFPDHALVHQLTMASLTACAGPWYADAGCRPHQVSKVFGYEVWNPMPSYQVASNIEASLRQKMEALKQHTSQIENINYLDAVEGLAKYRGIMSMAGTYAEVFEALKIESIL